MRSTRHTTLLFTLFACSTGAQERDFGASAPYVERARQTANVTEISVQNAIERALTSNLEIRLEGYNRASIGWRLVGAHGYFDPSFGIQAGLNTSASPATNTLQGGQGLSSQTDSTMRFGPTITQNLPGGGTLVAGLGNTRQSTNNAFTFLNPLYGTNLDFSLTQPLWRGAFFQNAASQRIRLIKLDSRLTDNQFRQRVVEVVQLVSFQYWNLVLAIETHETQRQSRELAVTQYENTRQRVQAGLLTPVAISSALAEVASREGQMIQSETQILQAQNALRQSLSPDPQGDLWDMVLIPTDRPKLEEPDMSLDEAVSSGLRTRPEMEGVRLQDVRLDLERRYLRNSMHPEVSLQATAGSIGRSGSLVPGVVIPGVSPPDLSNTPGLGGLPTSLGQVFGFQFPNRGVSINVRYPVFNRAARAELAEVEVAQQRLKTTLKSTQQRIIVEVRNAYEGLAVHKKSWEAASLATKLLEEQLVGETERFRAGFTTNFEILRYQRDLADARLRELQALINHQNALTTLRRASDRIIDANDLVLARQN